MGRSRTAWLLVGAVVVGSLVVPRVASAVTDLVTIQGGNGSTKASVTDGKQLQVAEATPSSFHEFSGGVGTTSCQVVATIPSTKGFVIRSIALDVITPSTTGIEIASLFPNDSCSGAGDIYSVATHVRAAHPVSLDPGFAIAPGGTITLRASAASVIAAHVWGYYVPPSDVPSTTKVN
jgi:hypothetical protein